MAPEVYDSTRYEISSAVSSPPSRFLWIKSTVRMKNKHLGYHIPMRKGKVPVVNLSGVPSEYHQAVVRKRSDQRQMLDTPVEAGQAAQHTVRWTGDVGRRNRNADAIPLDQ